MKLLKWHHDLSTVSKKNISQPNLQQKSLGLTFHSQTLNLVIFTLTLLSLPPVGFAKKTDGVIKDTRASELRESYQRELLFLSTYKKELLQKKSQLQIKMGQKTIEGKKQVQELEKKWIQIQLDNEVLSSQWNDQQRLSDVKDDNFENLHTILSQGISMGLLQKKSNPKDSSFPNSITKTNRIKTSETLSKTSSLSNTASLEENWHSQLETLFMATHTALEKSVKLTQEEGHFFNSQGEQQQGTIYHLGKVSRFGQIGNEIHSLYPTGQGHFKTWKKVSLTPRQMTSGQWPKSLNLFLFADPNREYIKKENKSWLQTIQAGGSIAWIIVLLGALAFILSGIRFVLLKKTQAKNTNRLKEIVSSVARDDIPLAKELCLGGESSVVRIMGRTLAGLTRNPNTIEDVITEGILHESKSLDRFGVFILVIASVAPLLGLLGTVTGMISTFDIITQFGTGDPKLLSGGISEALITTMLGLMVAIPTLLVGHYLGSINEAIKDDMEKWALAITSCFQKKES